ncbi:hypothetical protein MZK49_30415, partial [Ensifer sesbaniae]|uniref:hypothetical protein n=1 Tax=Ensifer sesbaniae TaxID=1214071 RepID=UPI00200097F9|nr:hypothetical protein [Ensifer sesbaniae]
TLLPIPVSEASHQVPLCPVEGSDRSRWRPVDLTFCLTNAPGQIDGVTDRVDIPAKIALEKVGSALY